MLVSQSQLARMIGLSQAAISAACKAGHLDFKDKKINTSAKKNKDWIWLAKDKIKRREATKNTKGRSGKTDQDRIEEEKRIRRDEYQNDDETFQKIDLERVNEGNIQQYAKIDIDKLSVIERTKLARLKTLRERGKLVDIDHVKTVFGKIISIEENELKQIPNRCAVQLAGFFDVDDPNINNEVRKKLEKEIYKVLQRIKNEIGNFLEQEKVA